ncbi:MAG: acyl carrier protein [Bacteroidales bacterium]|nr:acyl carrier protein [Bacteroidales bacterium]
MTTTTKVSISEKVKEYVKNAASIPPDMELKNDTLIFDEGLFDSMGFMALISFIDEEFGVQPGDDELVVENFESIDAIVNYLSEKLSA